MQRSAESGSLNWSVNADAQGRLAAAPRRSPVTSDVRSSSVSSLLLFVSLALALAGCAAPAQLADGPYNRGVDAYRAKDYESARALWTLEVAKGNPSAENNLGYLLYYGLGGPPDKARAVSLWRRSALAGQPEAQWHLGVAYADGEALGRSAVEAYAWYRCAIANGDGVDGLEREDGKVIAGLSRKSLNTLMVSMSKVELEQGGALAEQYIRQYANWKRRT